MHTSQLRLNCAIKHHSVVTRAMLRTKKASGVSPECINLRQLLDSQQPTKPRLISIGRVGGNDVVLSDDRGLNIISRKHAAVVHFDGKYVLMAKNSTNGVYVNNQPVPPCGRRILCNGDFVTFGGAAAIWSDQRMVDNPYAYVFSNDDSAVCGEKRKRTVAGHADDELTCAICQEFAAKAHVLVCGHLFCGCCMEQWFRVSMKKRSGPPNCPTCRTAVHSAHPVPVLDALIQKSHPNLSADASFAHRLSWEGCLDELDAETDEDARWLVEQGGGQNCSDCFQPVFGLCVVRQEIRGGDRVLCTNHHPECRTPTCTLSQLGGFWHVTEKQAQRIATLMQRMSASDLQLAL